MLVDNLLSRGDSVVAVDNLMYGSHAPLLDLAGKPNLRFVRGDVRDGMFLTRLMREHQPEFVIHLAALVGAPACHRDPETAVAVNVGGTVNVIRAISEACPDAHLVFASTDSSYGSVAGDGAVDETTPLCPLSEYGRDKEAAERLVRGARKYTILRFATAFGLSRRMRLDLMVNDFTWQAVHNRNLVVYEGGFRRTFLHVGDIVRAIGMVMDSDRSVGRIFNVGDDRLNFTKAEVAALIAEIVPGTALNLAGEGQDPDRRDYVISHQGIRDLGFEASTTLADGIRELVRGYAMLDIRPPWRNA